MIEKIIDFFDEMPLVLKLVIVMAVGTVLTTFFPEKFGPEPEYAIELTPQDSLAPYEQYFPLQLEDIQEDMSGGSYYTYEYETIKRKYEMFYTMQTHTDGDILYCMVVFPAEDKYDEVLQMVFDSYDHSDKRTYLLGGEKLVDKFPEFAYTTVEIDAAEWKAEKAYHVMDGNGEWTKLYVLCYPHAIARITFPQARVTEQQRAVVGDKLLAAAYIEWEK